MGFFWEKIYITAGQRVHWGIICGTGSVPPTLPWFSSLKDFRTTFIICWLPQITQRISACRASSHPTVHSVTQCLMTGLSARVAPVSTQSSMLKAGFYHVQRTDSDWMHFQLPLSLLFWTLTLLRFIWIERNSLNGQLFYHQGGPFATKMKMTLP